MEFSAAAAVYYTLHGAAKNNPFKDDTRASGIIVTGHARRELATNGKGDGDEWNQAQHVPFSLFILQFTVSQFSHYRHKSLCNHWWRLQRLR